MYVKGTQRLFVTRLGTTYSSLSFFVPRYATGYNTPHISLLNKSTTPALSTTIASALETSDVVSHIAYVAVLGTQLRTPISIPPLLIHPSHPRHPILDFVGHRTLSTRRWDIDPKWNRSKAVIVYLYPGFQRRSRAPVISVLSNNVGGDARPSLFGRQRQKTSLEDTPK